jgi:hypothetical protein
MMRIYLPGTMRDLARLRDEGALAGGFTAHAVTPALREWYAGSDTEELEHAAFLDAERRSLHRLAVDPTVVRLRVVIAADVPDDVVLPGGGDDEDRAVVVVRGGLSVASVASVHVDEVDAQADVTAAIEALGAAAEGDDDAQFTVDSAEGHDLLWYDVTELDDVLVLDEL